VLGSNPGGEASGTIPLFVDSRSVTSFDDYHDEFTIEELADQPVIPHTVSPKSVHPTSQRLSKSARIHATPDSSL